MSFILIALEELNDSIDLFVRNTAIAVRMSNLEGDDFTNFVFDENVSDKQKKPKTVNHEEQMQQFLQG